MYSQQEHREKLKQEAKNYLFDQEFAAEVERQISEKQANQTKTLSEATNVKRLDTQKWRQTSRFEVTGDDENKTLMWRSLMKDCAFYYDVPTIDDEMKMKKTLQRKYDPLFTQGWRPALTTRKDLVTWACKQYNGSLEAREIPVENHVNCDNYKALLEEFGPDYSKLRGKLGHVRGLFE